MLLAGEDAAAAADGFCRVKGSEINLALLESLFISP